MKSEKRSIEIEDLLRLKRAERPPAEFWARFDRELRAKQLSALVAKRPWWQRLPGAFTSLRPYRLPLGAAAALTVTFVTLRDPESAARGDKTGAASVSGQAIAVVSAEVVSHSKVLIGSEASTSGSLTVERALVVAPSAGDVSSVLVLAAAQEVAPAPESAPRSLLGVSSSEFASSDGVAGLRHVAAGLTMVPTAEVLGARGLLANASMGFETRGLPGRTAVEPLQQVTPPGERARHKLLTAMMTMPSADMASRAGERVGDRLSEERLYDQVSRFGARGAGVSMKF